jgi:hypothetical protein
LADLGTGAALIDLPVLKLCPHDVHIAAPVGVGAPHSGHFSPAAVIDEAPARSIDSSLSNSTGEPESSGSGSGADTVTTWLHWGHLTLRPIKLSEAFSRLPQLEQVSSIDMGHISHWNRR